MIVGAAFVPQTPLLVPEIAQGATAELTELADACRAAVRRAGVGATRWIVLGAADTAGRFAVGSVGTFAGFGVPLEVVLGAPATGPARPSLPPALAVGAWLLHDALGPVERVEGIAVGADARGADAPADGDPCALLVVGDASACRTEKAPGHLDPRAEAFDAAVARDLAGGEPDALRRSLAEGTAAELLCAGAPAWAAAADLLSGHGYDADLLHDSAPYGVGYLVAAWTARA